MQFLQSLSTPISSISLGIFRISFGALILLSTIRFIALGWIEEQILQPKIHFQYYGFEWITVPSSFYVYLLYSVLIIASFCVMIGYKYRIMSVLLFLAFTYTELWDLSYYLNHYYAVSLFSFLLCFLPAHCIYSVDSTSKPSIYQALIPRYYILLLQFQIAIIYLYAGIAKIQYDWLIQALPLSLWLPSHSDLPIIGNLLSARWTSYVFSWFGMLYDCTIPLFLSLQTTRIYAYIAVICFHTITGILFQIGVFPLVMIVLTLIFFPPEQLLQIINRIFALFNTSVKVRANTYKATSFSIHPIIYSSLIAYCLFQLLFPFRYVLYPGNVYWTEQGYRFGWRVMLIEKSGYTQFTIKDSLTGKKGIIDNAEWLTDHQEKQMSMQPDLIVQFAHTLSTYYQKNGYTHPIITADSWVTLNGRKSYRFIDSSINLASINDSWFHKKWILSEGVSK